MRVADSWRGLWGGGWPHGLLRARARVYSLLGCRSISPGVFPPNRPVVDTRSCSSSGASGGGLGGAFFCSDFSHFTSCHHAANARHVSRPRHEDKRGRLPTLDGPSRAGQPHLELKLQPLFRVRHARDAGMEGRDRLAKGIARDVVAGLIVHHMRRAYHLVHPDDRLLSAPPVRRPAQAERPTPVKLGVGWTFDRARAAHIAAAQSQQQIFRRREDT